jgi:beta-fructofuranosidase
VGLVKITGDTAELMPPLLSPLVYDDIECPCVFKFHERFYLLGSIREDIKVRYWFAPGFFGEYHSFHADVILPAGNYAARIVEDGPHLLIYNFFYAGRIDALRVLPPPKQLDVDADGRLILRSYYRWEQMVTRVARQDEFAEPTRLFGNPTAYAKTEKGKWICGSRSGYEIFCVQRPSASFIWEGHLTVEGMGKLGLVTDIDKDGNGYYISFNVINGLVQIRAWGFNPMSTKQNFIFNDIQSNSFATNEANSFWFKLIRFGHYIELSIDHVVKLTLIDYTYSGQYIGLYSASSVISLANSTLSILPEPEGEYASQEEAQKLQE